MSLRTGVEVLNVFGVAPCLLTNSAGEIVMLTNEYTLVVVHSETPGRRGSVLPMADASSLHKFHGTLRLTAD